MTASERLRLAAILGMLGSNSAGERDNAARMAENFRRQHNLTWDELLGLPAVVPEVVPEPAAPWTSPPEPRPPPAHPWVAISQPWYARAWNCALNYSEYHWLSIIYAVGFVVLIGCAIVLN
jgi:hypothetical protein